LKTLQHNDFKAFLFLPFAPIAQCKSYHTRAKICAILA